MTKDINIKLVELQNKSRKGLYYYIKQKGSKPTYLKYNPQFALDSYVEYYKDRFVTKEKKGTIKSYQKAYSGQEVKKSYRKKYEKTFTSADKYYKKLKKQPQFNQVISKGMSKVTIQNIQYKSLNDISEAKKELFKNLVADEDLIDILIQDDNLAKLKNRIETKIEFKDNVNVLAYSGKIGMTPNEVYNKLKGQQYIGIEVDTQDRYETIFSNKVIFNGFNTPKLIKSGSINQINVTFIFRKNR